MTIEEANEPFVSGVKAIIERENIKHISIAKKSGYTRQAFSDILNGRKLIKACDMPLIAKTLNVSIEDIFDIGTCIKKLNR